VHTTREQRLFFADRGYLPFGRIYSESEVEVLRQFVSEVRDIAVDAFALGDRPAASVVIATKPVNEPGKITLSLRNMFRVHEQGHRHAFNPTIAGAAGELLETEQVRLLMDQAIIKEPGISGTIGWHQDFSDWPLERPTQVTCWLALDPATKQSGALQYVPGSHKLGVFARARLGRPVSQRGDADSMIPPDPAAVGHQTVVVELEPGECVFHHSLVWHASGPNTTDRSRRGLITRFMARGPKMRCQRAVAADAACVQPELLLESDDDFPIVWQRS